MLASPSLNLMWNGIHHEGAAHLAKPLSKCTKLTALSLGYNHVFVEGARALAEIALPKLRNVRTAHCTLARGRLRCSQLQLVFLVVHSFVRWC